VVVFWLSLLLTGTALVVEEGEGGREGGRGEGGGGVQDAATILAQDLGSSISTSDSVSLPPGL